MGGRRRHASTGSGADLAALIHRRHDTLLANVDAARAGDVEGVHQARVASRRLREAVPVLGAGLDGVRVKRLGRRLRELTRALGPVRELDVATAMIAELPLEGDDAFRLRTAWTRWLDARRKAPARALRKALAPSARSPLEKHLAAFEAARAASDDAEWRQALAARLTARADALKQRIDQTGALYDPTPLHEVRIAAKKLRYALELGNEAGLAPLDRPLRTIKSSQDALGRLHDLDVLLGLLRAWQEAPRRERMVRAAADVVGALEHESRMLHARYLQARAALLRVTDITRDRIVPRVLSGPAARAPARVAAHAR